MSATFARPRYRFFPNVMALQERRLARKVRRLGLISETHRLGADTMHVWRSLTPPSIERPAVLFVHGFGAAALWQWPSQIEALAEHYSLIVPDLLWFGDSSSKHHDFHPDHQVEAVANLLDRLRIRRLHAIVGLSYGGLITWELASRQPIPIKRTVLVSTPGPVYERTDYLSMLERLGIESLDQLLLPSEPDDVLRLLEIAYARQPWTPGWVRLQVIEAFCEAHRHEKAELLDVVISQMGQLRERSSTLDTPALVMWGQDDPVFPFELGQRLTDYIGERGRMHAIRDARHASNIEFPREFNRVLFDFLSAPEA